MNLIRNARKFNRYGVNAYAKSEFEPILPDFPYKEGSNGRSENSGLFQKSHKTTGRVGGITKRGKLSK
jgi:hypothetical protein